MARREPFFLVVVDEDRGRFNVLGPMSDDTDWTNRVYNLQQTGHRVRCFTSSGATTAEIARSYEVQTGYSFAPEPLFSAPVPVVPGPSGPIPKYARRADPLRLVKVTCRSGCRKERWAEMDKPYPGDDVLSSAQVGDYTATCLKCGAVARDPYNWTR